MHPRNPYNTPPDFGLLAEAYPNLKPYVLQTSSGRYSIDFKNPIAQRLLTQCLLHRDFGITLTLPENRLCPPVPNRLNYLLWLQDLLDSTYSSCTNRDNEPIKGLDVGTGASAIYPLLGCRLFPNWMFVGTDIDPQSLASASNNVSANDLSTRITILPSSPSSPLFFPIFDDASTSFNFTMCNPPFYASREDVVASSEAKASTPSAVCTGSEVEMITAGGEAGFVGRMVEESVRLKDRCRWYTSMLGIMSSLVSIIEPLKSHDVDNYALTELVQGDTRRWVIAWSFLDDRVPDRIGRPKTSNPTLHSLLPPHNTLSQQFPRIVSSRQLFETTKAVLGGIEGVTFGVDLGADSSDSMDVDQESENERPALGPSAGPRKVEWELSVQALSITWTRAARRANKKNAETPAASLTSVSHSTQGPIMRARIRCMDSGGNWVTECDWVKGKERVVWEGWWAHVARKIGEHVRGEM